MMILMISVFGGGGGSQCAPDPINPSVHATLHRHWLDVFTLDPTIPLSLSVCLSVIPCPADLPFLQLLIVLANPLTQADDVWEAEDYNASDIRHQQVVRWYASDLVNKGNSESSSDRGLPKPTDAPQHRFSSDVSVDYAIGKAVTKHNLRSFQKFGKEEHTLLMWNTKNVEYALGANICDLSTKYWDSDDRHAFDGDHVMLKQGYSSVIDRLETDLGTYGDQFQCRLNFDVGKIEYARKTTTLPYTSSRPRAAKCIELSDTCCVTSRDTNETEQFDFIVSTLPLGVLKASVEAADLEAKANTKSKPRTESTDEKPTADTTTKVAPDPTPSRENADREDIYRDTVCFDPPLPFTKADAIKSTGFGLLNKVYLQFPKPFWRLRTVLDDDQNLFGNASGFNSHHYMFFDVGKGMAVGENDSRPAILMVLISGMEAVASELMTEEEVVQDVTSTLRCLFTDKVVPDPVASKVTRWGSDKFSRGCYTFLPPGATDQDFQILQSPVNGNGDSIVLEGSETMRLFWAGEHTTSLHPSMAHGAMLSGMRAAKEVLSTITLTRGIRTGFDKQIPLSLFRKSNPTTKLQCHLCGLVGSRMREGSLLAFQRGTRQILVHNNCGESSPEVEVRDGQWKSIIKAVNRGKQINCCMCGRPGATVGCTHDNCFRSFHFSCAEDTGWRFERDGKVYFCDRHRKFDSIEPNACDQVSLFYYRMKQKTSGGVLRCSFCMEPGGTDSDGRTATGKAGGRSGAGKLLAFQQRNKLLLVHDRCARYATILETTEEPENLTDTDFKNLFEILRQKKVCHDCGMPGATIKCTSPSCDTFFHYPCAVKTKWNFRTNPGSFVCTRHRKANTTPTVVARPSELQATSGVAPSQPLVHPHALLQNFALPPVAQLRPGPSHALFGGHQLFQHNLFQPTASQGMVQTPPGVPIINGGTKIGSNNTGAPLAPPTLGQMTQTTTNLPIMNGTNPTVNTQGSATDDDGKKQQHGKDDNNNSDEDVDDDDDVSEGRLDTGVLQHPLCDHLHQSQCNTLGGPVSVQTISRPDPRSPWNFNLSLTAGGLDGTSAVILELESETGEETTEHLLKTINGAAIGSDGHKSLSDVLAFFRGTTSVLVELQRIETKDSTERNGNNPTESG